MTKLVLVSGWAFVFASFGQVSRPYVRATGEATVSAKPDQVQLSASVTTQASTAQEAADTNANQMSNLLQQLRALLGDNGEIKSTGYSVSQQQRSQVGSNTIIISYYATNSISVILFDISIAGKVIDLAAQSGATGISGLNFGLKDPSPLRREALKQATQQARIKADAIASGVNMKVTNVVALEESGSVSVRSPSLGLAVSASTPVVSGLVDVSASVLIQAEIQ